MLASPDRWRVTLFSKLALIFQFIYTRYIEIQLWFGKWKLSSLMFYCCVCMWKTFPALFYVICRSAIGELYRVFARWIFILAENYRLKFSLTVTKYSLKHKIHSLKRQNKKLFCVLWDASCEDSVSFPKMRGCVILQILLTQPTMCEIFIFRKGERN